MIYGSSSTKMGSGLTLIEIARHWRLGSTLRGVAAAGGGRELMIVHPLVMVRERGDQFQCGTVYRDEAVVVELNLHIDARGAREWILYLYDVAYILQRTRVDLVTCLEGYCCRCGSSGGVRS